MDSFEKVIFTGLLNDQYSILWVEHTDKGRLELNFVIPRIELSSGHDLDLYSHRRDLPIFDMWKNGINKKYSLADPNDPRRARTMSERTKNARVEGTIVANRKNLDETLHQLVQKGEIKSRQHMLELLESSGYHITRKNTDSISVKHEDIGKKALRLKGGIYCEDFRSNREFKSISTTREQRTREHGYQATQAEIRESRLIYQRYLQVRTERHKKRYPRGEQDHQEKSQHLKTRDSNDNDREINFKNEREIINDRIRQHVRNNIAKRDEFNQNFRRREGRVLEQTRESSLELSRVHEESERKLLERIRTSRALMAEGNTKYAEQIYHDPIRSDSKIRRNAKRIHELLGRVNEQFSRLKKSIEGVIHELKKRSIFNSAKEKMESSYRPTINFTPRR